MGWIVSVLLSTRAFLHFAASSWTRSDHQRQNKSLDVHHHYLAGRKSALASSRQMKRNSANVPHACRPTSRKSKMNQKSTKHCPKKRGAMTLPKCRETDLGLCLSSEVSAFLLEGQEANK